MNLETGELKLNIPDTVVTGRSVSRGIAFGKAVCLFGARRQFFKTAIPPEDVETEIARLSEGVSAASRQLQIIIGDAKASKPQKEIFESHLLLLNDSTLFAAVRDLIATDKINCEWAVSKVIEEFSAQFKQMSDEHFRERHIDIEDVGERLIAALGGKTDLDFPVVTDAIIVAQGLNPSTLMEIASRRPAGIVTENGGWTSHVFILARELGIPAVTGIRQLTRRTDIGATIIVDGYKGEIVLIPSKETIARYKSTPLTPLNAVRTGDLTGRTPVVQTLDGIDVRICANLDLVRGSDDVSSFRQFGIGLYRSEYLFKRYSDYPNEELQFERYSEILKLAGDANVKIRTFDLSIGEYAGHNDRIEVNPALGLRGIRLSLRYVEYFRLQLRALLRASYKRQLDIVLPMVGDIGDIRRARSLISEEAERLTGQGIKHGNPRLGAMIEIPATVFHIREILDEVEFINIGTNDLVQYILAVDRDNDVVADFFNSLHPSFLRALELIFAAAANADKEAVVCGEMAGSPLYTPLLAGLGARCLSMNPASIDRISRVLTHISIQEAREIASIVLNCSTAEEAETTLKRHYGQKWPHLDQIAANLSST